MRDLHQLQTEFQNLLLLQASNIAEEIISTENISVETRLNIYRDAYYLRLLESLQLDYPALHIMLGDERFDQLGRAYIIAYPSSFRSVRWFGNKLTHFMRTQQWYMERPVLIELTEFEWALTEAFDASDSDVITIEDMASIPSEQWPAMKYILHPSVRFLNLQWNAVAIWKAMQAEQTPPAFEQSDILISWIIWRKDYQLQFRSFPVDEAYMLYAMQAGDTFEMMCAGLCEWIDEQNVAMHAASLLKRFIIDGLISEIYY